MAATKGKGGRPPRDVKQQQFSIRMEPRQLETLDALADLWGLSRSETIGKALASFAADYLTDDRKKLVRQIRAARAQA